MLYGIFREPIIITYQSLLLSPFIEPSPVHIDEMFEYVVWWFRGTVRLTVRYHLTFYRRWVTRSGFVQICRQRSFCRFLLGERPIPSPNGCLP